MHASLWRTRARGGSRCAVPLHRRRVGDGKGMNLYNLMGPMAGSAGRGVLYGVEESHGAAFWASVLAGAVVGFATFLQLRRVAVNAHEESLRAIYVATPVCVLTATLLGALVLRATL